MDDVFNLVHSAEQASALSMEVVFVFNSKAYDKLFQYYSCNCGTNWTVYTCGNFNHNGVDGNISLGKYWMHTYLFE